MLARVAVAGLALLVGTQAQASIDPACADLAAQGPPEGYSEVAQQDFLQNYFALSSTLSPLHGPVPHEGGHGAFGIDANGIPPLGCRRRLVLGYTKTEDTNKSPVFPRLRVTFAFPQIGRTVIYAGAAYVPPVEIFGVSAPTVSAELGLGAKLGETLQVGARFHSTITRPVAEIATPFIEGDPAFDDLFIASTFGVDGMIGIKLDNVVPYVSAGLTDASTFFYIGDDSVTVNNFHPYLGLVMSAGIDARLTDTILAAAEAYAAPGGYNLPDPNVETIGGRSYGHLYTLRVRLALEL